MCCSHDWRRSWASSVGDSVGGAAHCCVDLIGVDDDLFAALDVSTSCFDAALLRGLRLIDAVSGF